MADKISRMSLSLKSDNYQWVFEESIRLNKSMTQIINELIEARILQTTGVT